MNNKTGGTKWEQEFCDLAAQHGFYAHQNADTRAGQPYDVQLCKNNICTQVDCKVVHGDSFSRSNIQDNQITAFRLLEHRGCFNNFFAVKFIDDTGAEDYRVLPNTILSCNAAKSFKREQLPTMETMLCTL